MDTFAEAGCLGPDLKRFPHADGATAPIEYLQQPGEMLIFPGRWWHQTYHYGRTLGLAGEVLHDGNLRRVMEHIIRWCQLDAPEEDLWSSPASGVIAEVLAEAIDSM